VTRETHKKYRGEKSSGSVKHNANDVPTTGRTRLVFTRERAPATTALIHT